MFLFFQIYLDAYLFSREFLTCCSLEQKPKHYQLSPVTGGLREAL